MTDPGTNYAIAAYGIALLVILGYAGILVYRCFRSA
jgi:hypothetical protein